MCKLSMVFVAINEKISPPFQSSRLPPGKPSQISSLSYRQKTPAGGVGSGSISKLSNSKMISDILGAKIMNVQSRLLGYFSGKPGDLMTPLLEVKFLEHSGPAWGGEEFVYDWHVEYVVRSMWSAQLRYRVQIPDTCITIGASRKSESFF